MCDYALIKNLPMDIARTIIQYQACSYMILYHPCVIGINDYA